MLYGAYAHGTVNIFAWMLYGAYAHGTVNIVAWMPSANPNIASTSLDDDNTTRSTI